MCVCERERQREKRGVLTQMRSGVLVLQGPGPLQVLVSGLVNSTRPRLSAAGSPISLPKQKRALCVSRSPPDRKAMWQSRQLNSSESHIYMPSVRPLINYMRCPSHDLRSHRRWLDFSGLKENHSLVIKRHSCVKRFVLVKSAAKIPGHLFEFAATELLSFCWHPLLRVTVSLLVTVAMFMFIT